MLNERNLSLNDQTELAQLRAIASYESGYKDWMNALHFLAINHRNKVTSKNISCLYRLWMVETARVRLANPHQIRWLRADWYGKASDKYTTSFKKFAQAIVGPAFDSRKDSVKMSTALSQLVAQRVVDYKDLNLQDNTRNRKQSIMKGWSGIILGIEKNAMWTPELSKFCEALGILVVTSGSGEPSRCSNEQVFDAVHKTYIGGSPIIYWDNHAKKICQGLRKIHDSPKETLLGRQRISRKSKKANKGLQTEEQRKSFTDQQTIYRTSQERKSSEIKEVESNPNREGQKKSNSDDFGDGRKMQGMRLSRESVGSGNSSFKQGGEERTTYDRVQQMEENRRTSKRHGSSLCQLSSDRTLDPAIVLLTVTDYDKYGFYIANTFKEHLATYGHYRIIFKRVGINVSDLTPAEATPRAMLYELPNHWDNAVKVAGDPKEYGIEMDVKEWKFYFKKILDALLAMGFTIDDFDEWARKARWARIQSAMRQAIEELIENDQTYRTWMGTITQIETLIETMKGIVYEQLEPEVESITDDPDFDDRDDETSNFIVDLIKTRNYEERYSSAYLTKKLKDALVEIDPDIPTEQEVEDKVNEDAT